MAALVQREERPDPKSEPFKVKQILVVPRNPNRGSEQLRTRSQRTPDVVRQDSQIGREREQTVPTTRQAAALILGWDPSTCPT